jgi:Spy/CpxP family protein refolding chaperone
MKRDWLLYLVIFSLALNVGTIGTFAYLRWQDQQVAPPPPEMAPLPFRKLMRKLDLDREQRQALRRMVPEHHRKVRELHKKLAQHRQELFGLFKQQNLPDWPPIQSKVREIGGLQLRLQEEMVHHLLEVQKNLNPEQRQVLVTNLEKRLSRFRGRRGRHRGPMRHMWGPGSPPGPPGPLGPPGPPGPR